MSIVHKVIKWFGKIIILKYDIEIVDKENLPKKGGCILVINHPGIYDGFIVDLVAPRPVYFLTKDRIFKTRYGLALKAMGHIPVFYEGKRSHETITLARKRLNKGGCIGVFAEGRALYGPHLRKFKTGAARLALLSRVPIIPATLIGTATRDRNRNKFPKFGPIKLYIGKPMTFEKYPQDDSDRKLNQKIVDSVNEEIHKMMKKHKVPEIYLPKK